MLSLLSQPPVAGVQPAPCSSHLNPPCALLRGSPPNMGRENISHQLISSSPYFIKTEEKTSKFRVHSFLPLPSSKQETSGVGSEQWWGFGLGEAAGGRESGGAPAELPRPADVYVSREVVRTEDFPRNPGWACKETIPTSRKETGQ